MSVLVITSPVASQNTRKISCAFRCSWYLSFCSKYYLLALELTKDHRIEILL